MKSKNKWEGSYNYEGLIRYWLNNYTGNDSKSTAGHRLSYTDNTLYSYATLIAVKYANYIWVSSDDYSRTTSRQRSILLANVNKPIVFCPYVNNSANYEYFNSIITETIQKVQRARKPHTVSAHKQALRDHISNYNNYIKYINNAKEQHTSLIMTALMVAKE